MRRGLPMYFAFLLLLASTAFTQDHGRLGVTVQTQPESPSPAGPAVGAKVIVVHWTHSQLHPQMVQDQVATTDANGTCTIDLPVGTYDVFVTATGLAPQRCRRVSTVCQPGSCSVILARPTAKAIWRSSTD